MGRSFCCAVFLLLTGCVMTGLSEVESDPDFDWDTLKRDWILMTPLFDLRESSKAPPGHGDELRFFSAEERLSYPERFKQEFFKLRADIRVFGAGGAFDNVAKIPGLGEVARQVIAKEPVPQEKAGEIRAKAQDLRFVFFFAMTDEDLRYGITYQFRKDQREDVIVYESKRLFTVRMALWDSQENKTVWIGTQHFSPTSTNAVQVFNPFKVKRKRKAKNKKGYEIYWVGRALSPTLASERKNNPDRFPAFPGREPAFSESFDDFALSLPINPEEEKLIEYTYFTYHRPQAALSMSQLGAVTTAGLELAFSSVINYRYRLGGALTIPLSNAEFDTAEGPMLVSSLAYGMTFDLEWAPRKKLRLLTGLMAGGVGYTITPKTPEAKRDPDDPDDPDRRATGEEETLEEEGEADGAWILWPRVRVLLGDKEGVQWGGGATYRATFGIDEALLKEHPPASWSVELFLAYAFRGF